MDAASGFYIAVRAHSLPAVLEEIRRKIVFDWETEEEHRTFSPSDALFEAIRCDHVVYAEYLLKHYAENY